MSSVGTYPNQGRYNWARWLIWASTLFAFIRFLVDLYGVWLFKHADEASRLSLRSYDSALENMAWIQTALLIVSGLVFLNWWSKSRDNLGRLGVLNEHTNTQLATACWIIPIVSLWLPYQSTRDMLGNTAPPSTLWWWLCWMGSNILSRLAQQSAKHAETLDALSGAMQQTLFADVALIAAGILITPVIDAVQRRQSVLAAQYSAEMRGPVPETML